MKTQESINRDFGLSGGGNNSGSPSAPAKRSEKEINSDIYQTQKQIKSIKSRIREATDFTQVAELGEKLREAEKRHSELKAERGPVSRKRDTPEDGTMKALRWHRNEASPYGREVYTATGGYNVVAKPDGGFKLLRNTGRGAETETLGEFKKLPEARKAALNHYNERIRSARETKTMTPTDKEESEKPHPAQEEGIKRMMSRPGEIGKAFAEAFERSKGNRKDMEKLRQLTAEYQKLDEEHDKARESFLKTVSELTKKEGERQKQAYISAMAKDAYLSQMAPTKRERERAAREMKYKENILLNMEKGDYSHFSNEARWNQREEYEKAEKALNEARARLTLKESQVRTHAKRGEWWKQS